MNLYRNLFRALHRENVRYLVVGGVAANLHGIERATGDIDLLLDLQSENVDRFLKAARDLGLTPKVPVPLEDFADVTKRKTWREDKGMLVFPLYDPEHPFFLLDVMTEVLIDFERAYEEKLTVDLGGIPITTASIQVLIDMKKDTGRPQDEADVHHLKIIQESDKNE